MSLVLSKFHPYLTPNGKIHDDFTLFVPTAELEEFLESHITPKGNKRPKIDCQESVVFRLSGGSNVSGRIHAAQCFDGEYYSVTLRSLRPQKYQKYFARENATARQTYGLDRSNTPTSFSLPEDTPGWRPEKSLERAPVLSRLLYDHCLKPEGKNPTGLVLFAGGTGSGKTTYLNGMLRIFLQERYPHLSAKRRPHVVVIGDPVETFCYPLQEDAETKNTPKQIAEIQNKIFTSRPFDFTARTLKKDTPSVEDALKDCLRETPAAVVVGELREDKDFVAALNFAGTGHLIFATSHSTSLADAMSRLLQVNNAQDHPAARANVAQRLLAVIHHQVISSPVELPQAQSVLNIPSIWRGNSEGRRNLTADGLSSLVSRAPDRGMHHSGVLGRYWITTQLRKQIDFKTNWKGDHRRNRSILYDHFERLALALDLQNR